MTFQQVPMRFMPIPVGSVGSIGLETASAKAVGGTLRRPGLSCKTLDSNQQQVGANIAVPGKSRTTFQHIPVRFMPSPVGTVLAIGSERAIAIEAIGVTSMKLGLLCETSDSSREKIGTHIAVPEKGRTIFQQIPM